MEKTVTFADGVAYFTRVAQLRYEISRLMRNYELIEEINPSDGKINPYYGRTRKNLDAGIAVEFLNDVIPYCIDTYFGSMEINPGETRATLELSYQFATDSQKIGFIRDFREKFGATVLQPYQVTKNQGNILQPVIYQIGPAPVEVLPNSTVVPEAQIQTEQTQWEKIRSEVDIDLRTSGRTNMTFVDAQTPKRKSMLTIIPAKTPQNLAKDHG